MTILLSLFTVLALGGPGPGKGAAKGTPTDSIGVEIRGGQRFVKHRVTAGETLTALTRRYHVTLELLTAANPQIKNGLGIGQIVFVPRPAAGKAAAASPAAKVPAASGALPAKHTVAKGETLFAIARKYQVTPDELIRLNKLPGNGSVRVGQQLQIAGAAEAAAPAPAAATPAAPTPAPVRPAEVEAVPATTVAKTPPPAPDKPAQIATVTPAASAEKEKEKEEERTPTRAGELLSRVVESGLGAPIEKSVTDKYLALHKTAPVGTIMQVRNSMNGLSVYVRVIGKLPDTGENNNILVRLSPRAVQKLGTADSRFRVETNYIPQ
ncbi:LysM peptidoglycan-binding domain-containing protein [Hymenobacter sp. BT523]|uniref:DPBB and LysM peptidoglycan-binding domain-containing protein n=1 Tax=Hymenobacter sp. BT523 TaxID=2795725 RepID=UPI0018EE3009|nr:LysM peptidoglycan-binding domain-containing protein [Hymenobacter sp. BT523]MBJ6110312.1 LysM peptidoglycan-binding domain-containing protein [Hymenobacter sp. BT523]